MEKVMAVLIAAVLSIQAYGQDSLITEAPIVNEIRGDSKELAQHFIQLIKDDKHLPKPGDVEYRFLITYVTPVKDGESVSKEDLRTGNFLNKIELADWGKYGNFKVNSFYFTKDTKDTVFLDYTNPQIVIVGSRKKAREGFSVKRHSEEIFRKNQRFVRFFSFCREKEIEIILNTATQPGGIIPAYAFCVSKNAIYVVKAMNVDSALPINDFVDSYWNSFAW